MLNSKLFFYCLLVASFLLIEAKRTNFSNIKSPKISVKTNHDRIIGGEEITPHSAPFQAGLWINNQNAFCGGSLISQNYVLTAAHCGIVVYSNVDVVLGAHNLSDETEITRVTIPAASVLVHEQYDRRFFRNDISLIKLSKPAPLNAFIQPIQLPLFDQSNATYDKKQVIAYGWGTVKDYPFPSLNDMSPVLKSVELPITSLAECEGVYNDADSLYVSDTNICTSGYRSKGTCSGDSGGPLVYDNVLIGLTSFGSEYCEDCSPSVYTKIASFLKWIQDNSDVVL